MSAIDLTSPLPFSSTNSTSKFRPIRFGFTKRTTLSEGDQSSLVDKKDISLSEESTNADVFSFESKNLSRGKPNRLCNDSVEIQQGEKSAQVIEEKPAEIISTASTDTTSACLHETFTKQEKSIIDEDLSQSKAFDDTNKPSVTNDDPIISPSAEVLEENTEPSESLAIPSSSSVISSSIVSASGLILVTENLQLSDKTSVSGDSHESGKLAVKEGSDSLSCDEGSYQRAYTDDDIDDTESGEYWLDQPETERAISTQLTNQNTNTESRSHDINVEQQSINDFTKSCSVAVHDGEGTMKPTSEDFVSLPPPPPEVAFSSPSQHTVATPRVFGNSQTATRSHTWQPQVQDLPLPPPPEDLPQPPPSSDYVKPSFLPAEKPKGFRSVARPVVKDNADDKSQRTLNSTQSCSSPPLKSYKVDEEKHTAISTAQLCNRPAERTSRNPPETPSFAVQNRFGYVTLLRDTRKILIKPTNSNNAKEETITKYSIQGKPFPAPPSTAAEITPKEQLPDGAVYQTVSKEGNVVHTDTYFPAADQNQSDPVVLERTKTTTIVQAPHHQGIGPVNDKGVPYALRSTVDDSKHWYKNMFKQMHKIEPGEETTKPSETPPQHNSGSNVSTVSHTSTEIPKPTKVGRIFDYQPAEPYVVENTPVKLNLNRRVNYESERSKSVNSNNNNNKGGTAVRRSSSLEDFSKMQWTEYFDDIRKPKANTAQLSSSSDTSNETSSSPAPVKSYSPSYTATSQHKMPETKKTTTTSGKVAQKPSKESDMRLPARGKFDFTAQTAKEYPLKKGHTVIITKQVDSNWYMVESVDGSKSGIVPVAYVEVVSGSSPEKPLRNGQARAKFDYTGTTKAELSFKKGDEIILLKRVDDNWFKGKLGNSTGILPVVYVEVIKEPESEPKKANQPTLSNQPQQTSPPRHSAASSLNAPAHSHQSSTLSQASSDEPDESERKNRAAFLANSVVGSKTSLHSRDSSTHREDILDHPELISESEVSQPQKVSLTANEPAQALDLSELNEVVEALSSGDKHPSNIAQPSPANNHLSPQSSALTPSIPSYPSSNISTQPSSPRLQTPPAMDFGQVIGRYVALYAYVASNDDELDLMPGDIVMVVETCDDGWYVGTCQRSGAFGTFPGNYVSLTNT